MKKNLLNINLSLLPAVVSLAWPTMLEQLMQTAVQYVDTAMVGSLGTQAVAAAGSTATVSWLVGSSISALGVGFLSYISQADGAGDSERVHRAVAQSVLTVIVCGLFFTALTVSVSGMIPVWMRVDPAIRDITAKYFMILYLPMLFRSASVIFSTVLRALGDSRTPMRVGIIVNLSNVIMNFLLIYSPRTMHIGSLSVPVWGAGMGVIGAAAASALAFVIGGVLVTLRLYAHPRASWKGYPLKPDPEVLRPCLKVALPNMMQRFATSFGYVVFAAMINSLGGLSTAAHTVANTVESAFYIPGYGMMTAAAALTGNAIGSRDRKKVGELAVSIIFCEVSLMILSGSLLFAFAPAMVSVFSHDPEVIALGTRVLRMVACSEPFYGVSIVIEGMFMGAGETKTPFRYNVGGMWLVRILGTFICIRFLHFGLVSAWACMITHNMILFLLYVRAYRSGRWNPLNAEIS